MSIFNIIHASCTDQQADAIVNAANRYLQAGGGICGAIFAKAGHAELQSACNKIPVPLNDGEAAITPSFHMSNCSHIIHAVGPNFSATPGAYEKLQDAYYSSLVLLKEANLHSIAFPMISSGIFSGNEPHPAALSALQARKAYEKFTSDFPDYEIEVKLCCFTKSEFEECQM